MKRGNVKLFWKFVKVILTNKQVVVIGEKDGSLNFGWNCRSVSDAKSMCMRVYDYLTKYQKPTDQVSKAHGIENYED